MLHGNILYDNSVRMRVHYATFLRKRGKSRKAVDLMGACMYRNRRLDHSSRGRESKVVG